MRKRERTLLLVGSGLLALALLAGACAAKGPAQGGSTGRSQETTVVQAGAPATSYDPKIDPANFVRLVDNPLFPLKPGTVYELQDKSSRGVEHETVTVTDHKKTILGVSTTVVEDVLKLHGQLEEKTSDWYAQDKQGNVWYFGEDTATYKNGKVDSREGSWKAGVHDARPGIIMNANPQVNDAYRQEYYRGHAEDMFWVIDDHGSVQAPYGSFHNAVLTLEWTPLEPNVVSEKYYAPGVGLVAERDLAGGNEHFELVRVTRSG
ncbi:MAG TPA: hypothetical protein VFJ72_03200 [Rubrobacteraceae bacterium]|nr:hypothetical protein [Rubrobacteraceae bacterium]